MKKLIGLVTILIVLQACKKDDPCAPIEGAMYTSPVMPYISVELVDNEGNNLLTNGTYDVSEITITKDGHENSIYIGEFKETISIITVYINWENSTQIATIELNENTIDTLELNVSVEKIECGSMPVVNTAIYNGQVQELNSTIESKYYPRITVVKQ